MMGETVEPAEYDGAMETSAIGIEPGDGHEPTVVVLKGEHDVHSAPAIGERVREVIGEGRALVIDLHEATFIDSSVLAAMLAARQAAREAGVGFAVCCPTDGSVTRILELTGLVARLPVLPDRAGAFELVRKPIA